MITVQTRDRFLQEIRKYLSEPCVCVELGVLDGDFSELLLKYLQPRLLMLVDPFEEGGTKYESGLSSAYSGDNNYQKVQERFKNNSLVVIQKDYSYNTVKLIEDNTVDVVYHDASHLYDDIKKDLNEWMPKVKKNGFITGHDMIDIAGFGVIRAVNEFIKEHSFELIIFNENGGDWALRKIQQ